MSAFCPALPLSALALAALLIAPVAQAAQSYDSCAGFIDSLPATISTQGTWCLRADLSTAMASGAAITIAANNVTLDCNHFKLGGLPAGPTPGAYGVFSLNRSNATVRNCTIRGFYVGARLIGSNGGHLIEDNRYDANYYAGIAVEGDGSVVRRNQVLDTGGDSGPKGIYARYSVDIIDNTVSNVVSNPATNADAWGIYTVSNLHGRIVGNAVRGLAGSGTGAARGMQHLTSGRLVMRDNDVIGPGSGTGLACASTGARAKDNQIIGFATGMVSCTDYGNVIAL